MSINTQEMAMTVAELTAPGKGILAADESVDTIAKRFKAVDVPNTKETRRDYREMLFSTPDLGSFISGVIMFEETLKQKSSAGVPLPELLKMQGILPGIKVDMGTVPLPSFPGETVTQGLEGLTQRLSEYKQLGARFAKWRAVIRIGAGTPTQGAIASNAYALARYAAICQEQALVPIVEPEVLMVGDHTLATSARVTEDVLHAVFLALQQQCVALEYIILKPNMVVSGGDNLTPASPPEVALATLNCLRRTVPAAVPGVFFLSGGQSETTSTANLHAMNSTTEKQPWVLSFSFGRALQESALEIWRGNGSNKLLAQNALSKRARLNSAATQGKYSTKMESS